MSGSKALCFAHDVYSLLVITQANILGMAQMVGRGPLEELDLCNQLRCEPCAILHLFPGEALSQTSGGGFRHVGERTRGSDKRRHAREEIPTRGGHKAGARW